MRKTLLVAVLAATILVTGCNTGNSNQSGTSSDGAANTVDSSSLQEASKDTASAEENSDLGNTLENKLAGLVRDEYDGIEMTAAVLEQKAIIPGAAFPVTVTIKNSGDKTVFYTHGSGSFQTPEAVQVNVVGLQPVMPKDHMGRATMDLVTKELKPGDTLKYVLYGMAIETNDEFDSYTYELFNSEETYIAEVPWSDLQAAHPDLTAASVSSYEGNAYFFYYIPQGAEGSNPTSEQTGYTQSEFVVDVSA